MIFPNYDFGLNTQAFAFYSGIRNFTLGIGPFPKELEGSNLFDLGDLTGSQPLTRRSQALENPEAFHQRGDDPGLPHRVLLPFINTYIIRCSRQ